MAMTRVARAHIDGRVIVPDEPVDLLVGQTIAIEFRPVAQSPTTPDRATIEDRRRRLATATGRIVAPTIPAEALRRENLYR